jgi:hypothetical protein
MTQADRQALVARLEREQAVWRNEHGKPNVAECDDWPHGRCELCCLLNDVLALLRADEAEPPMHQALTCLLDEFEEHFGTQGDVGLIEVRRWLETRHVHWTPAPSRQAGGAPPVPFVEQLPNALPPRSMWQVKGEFFYRDEFHQTWRLRPEGLPGYPLSISLERKD